ncbi:MAG: methionyl-tRNA formyltransferase, partial [Chloroflexota bacterium]|nr:methionyl-tRNA formyltransferase [Chloroflexota bacterium]
PTLRTLHANFEVVGVVTQPDRPAGRGRDLRPPDVKVLAQALDLPLMQPKKLKDPDAMAQLADWQPDVIVVAAFGQILPENVLTLPAHGCVNVHASLLPRWRGAAPVQAAVLHDDRTGVTIMRMDKGLDTGPILSQRSMVIPPEITAGDLFGALAEMGADLLVETLPAYLNGDITPQPQDDSKSTYAPRLNKSDGALDFSQPAAYLARMVRAYNPWPGAHQFLDGARLKVYRAHAVSGNAQPGDRLIVDELPAWGTAKGLLVLDEVQLAGRGRVEGEAFLHGAKNWEKRK